MFAGYVPNTKWIADCVERNEQGYLITDMDRQTNIAGVFAAGDVCVKNLRQVVTAVSDGAIAATSLERVVSELHAKLGIPDLYQAPQQSKTLEKQDEQTYFTKGEGFISSEIRQQLTGIFTKFSSHVTVRAWLDESAFSGEIKGFLNELVSITDKVVWTEQVPEDAVKPEYLPAMEVLDSTGKSSGIYFHGVPGGHEFNSFIIALYNVAGAGQELDHQTQKKIVALSEKTNIKILVSLTCTMCPDSVMAAQRIAAISDQVTAEMFDLSHYPELKEKYNVMKNRLNGVPEIKRVAQIMSFLLHPMLMPVYSLFFYLLYRFLVCFDTVRGKIVQFHCDFIYIGDFTFGLSAFVSSFSFNQRLRVGG